MTSPTLSVIQAEVEVDETNIPNALKLGPATAKVTIDAIPGQDLLERSRLRDRQQPAAVDPPRERTGTQATTFKVEVILDEVVPDVRPGFTCTADITTGTRKNATAVPIPSVAVRELTVRRQGPP